MHEDHEVKGLRRKRAIPVSMDAKETADAASLAAIFMRSHMDCVLPGCGLTDYASSVKVRFSSRLVRDAWTSTKVSLRLSCLQVITKSPKHVMQVGLGRL